ncbi:leucine-rich glioma-inactivated protein 1-like isoform X2 [Hyperolius riggenbachi]|uniref:leucine-rich glioma-inactivated protein 1-like isoform X2 n=1 Tax=Hyperolius riggenbachi TaxID=752182 RepID=UPI0035A2E26F
MEWTMRLSFWSILFFSLFPSGLMRAPRRPKPPRWKCPASCNCATDNVLCDGAAGIPSTYSADIISVSFLRCGFSVIQTDSFAPSQTLQILLFTSCTFQTISDDSFLKLKHLEYLFIENNKIKSISKNAFHGLRSLIHLSLANNHLESLPSGLFRPLSAIKHIDLRGNPLQCNCQMKWLVQWIHGPGKKIAVWPPLPCEEPTKMKGRTLTELSEKDFHCVTGNIVQRWSFKFPSLSVKSFEYQSEQYVVIAHPFEGSCTFLEWDHVAYQFRYFDTIKGIAVISCLPLVIGKQLFVVVAQLFNGTFVYRRDPSLGTITTFRMFQHFPDIRKPNDIESFTSLEGDHYFIIADSAKSGASTLYRWNGVGFYPQQRLPRWYRDTDAEPLILSGYPHLIMSSGSQRPLVYRFENKRLERLTDIPEAWDVYAVKHFTDAEDGVFACLVRYMGDSSLVRWDGSMFKQLQQLSSRGSHVFQPLFLGLRWHAFLGNDYGYAWVYQLEKWKHWEVEETNDKEGPSGPLVPLQELKVFEARALATVHVRGRQFIFVASFGGETVVYEYVEQENSI